MATITYAQVEDVVRQLPPAKLPLAYRILLTLSEEETETSSAQVDVLRLSLAERRQLLAKQAEAFVQHYEETEDERAEWQAGEFVKY